MELRSVFPKCLPPVQIGVVAPKEAAWGGGENVGSGVRTAFLPLGKQLLILPLGASENRSSTPSTRQIRKMVLVSQACTSPGQIFSSVDCSVAWYFCSGYPPLDVLLISVALKVWNGQS